MKFYFAGSIRGGREDTLLYAEIIKKLSLYGKILTEHLADPKISSYGESNMTDEEIFKHDVTMLESSDYVIAEVTVSSVGVGYELGIADKLGKPVICLYRPQQDKRLSAMLSGNTAFKIINYQHPDELDAVFQEMFGS
jgi:nucleoside 2-deoxyribosyltransferase